MTASRRFATRRQVVTRQDALDARKLLLSEPHPTMPEVTILFVGGLHWHPSCRRAYQSLLRSEIAKSGRPAFIAVEWDSGVVRARKLQRRLYREKWLAKRSQDKGSVIRSLATRLAWESDGHQGIVRDVPLIWLEECRADKPSAGYFGANKLFVEQLALGTNFTMVSSRDALAAINRAWILEADSVQANIPTPRDSSRDIAWHRQVSRAIRKFPGQWAVIVVGAVHASEWDSQTLYCLLSKEQPCRTEYLVWAPTIPGSPCG